jgi:hypothetical protein
MKLQIAVLLISYAFLLQVCALKESEGAPYSRRQLEDEVCRARCDTTLQGFEDQLASQQVLLGTYQADLDRVKQHIEFNLSIAWTLLGFSFLVHVLSLLKPFSSSNLSKIDRAQQTLQAESLSEDTSGNGEIESKIEDSRGYDLVERGGTESKAGAATDTDIEIWDNHSNKLAQFIEDLVRIHYEVQSVLITAPKDLDEAESLVEVIKRMRNKTRRVFRKLSSRDDPESQVISKLETALWDIFKIAMDDAVIRSNADLILQAFKRRVFSAEGK